MVRDGWPRMPGSPDWGRGMRCQAPVACDPEFKPPAGGRHRSGLEGTRPRCGRRFLADSEGQERTAGSEGPSGFLAGALGGTGSREKVSPRLLRVPPAQPPCSLSTDRGSENGLTLKNPADAGLNYSSVVGPWAGRWTCFQTGCLL